MIPVDLTYNLFTSKKGENRNRVWMDEAVADNGAESGVYLSFSNCFQLLLTCVLDSCEPAGKGGGSSEWIHVLGVLLVAEPKTSQLFVLCKNWLEPE